METKYYVDKDGKYLGGFAGSKPDGGIEVSPPEDVNQTYDFDDKTWIEADKEESSEV